MVTNQFHFKQALIFEHIVSSNQVKFATVFPTSELAEAPSTDLCQISVKLVTNFVNHYHVRFSVA